MGSKSYQIDIIHECDAKIDGSLVFSALPRSEWVNLEKPNENNQITIGINYLLIRGNGLNMLVDAGIGNLQGNKARAMYEIGDIIPINERLSYFGLSPDDITHVVFSHLHFPHCGGAFTKKDDCIIPIFKNAEFFVQKREWIQAVSPNELTRTYYDVHNLLPLVESNRLHLITGDVEIADNIYIEVTGGHTSSHQIVSVVGKHKRVVFPGDICPTPYHVELGIRNAFDIEPTEVLNVRKKLILKAFAHEAIIAFSHSKQAVFYELTDIDGFIKAVKFNEN